VWRHLIELFRTTIIITTKTTTTTAAAAETTTTRALKKNSSRNQKIFAQCLFVIFLLFFACRVYN